MNSSVACAKKHFSHMYTQSTIVQCFWGFRVGRHGGCALNRMATIVRVCNLKPAAYLSQTNFHPSGALERSYLSRSVLNCFSLLSMYLEDKPPSFQSVRRVWRERERERERRGDKESISIVFFPFPFLHVHIK